MSTKRALIVDDSRTACLALKRLLLRYGVEADSVLSAREALEFLKEKKPSVIFMDHTMPDMDGFEAIKRIKSDPSTAMIPVMMYTSRSGEVYVNQARALGAIDVLPKQFIPARIEQALQKVGILNKSNKPKVSETVDAGTEAGNQQQMNVNIEVRLRELLDEVILGKLRPGINQQLYTMMADWQGEQNELNRQIRKLLKDNLDSTNTVKHDQMHGFKESAHMQLLEMRKRNNRIFYTGLLGFAVLIGSIVWLFADNKQLSRQLEESFQASATVQASMHDMFTAQLDDLRNDINSNLIANQSNNNNDYSNNSGGGFTGPSSKLVRNDLGEVVGKFVGFSEDGKLINVLTRTDYAFQINIQGELASKLLHRYYLFPNCYGNAYVAAHGGMIFRAADRSVWYTDLSDDSLVIEPVSTMSYEGVCQDSQNNTPVEVRVLSTNQSNVTGIAGVNFVLSR